MPSGEGNSMHLPPLLTSEPQGSQPDHSRDRRVFRSFRLRIAGISVGVSSMEPTLDLQIEGGASKFLSEVSAADILLKAQWADLAGICSGAVKIFDSGQVWRLYQKEGIHLFAFSAPVFGEVPYMAARMRPGFQEGEVLFHRPYYKEEEPVSPLAYPLGELLLIHYLGLGRGVEVHACGIIDRQGEGRLFLGPSGAGKSTIARLWMNEPGITVLNDDRIILRWRGDEPWMYGTPWHGDAQLASPEGVRLSSLFLLQKAEENQVRPLGVTQALSRLLACSFLPYHHLPTMEFTLVFFEGLLKGLPALELRFTNTRQAVKYIQQLQPEDLRP